ncbi:MAG: M67 family metallopeptidase [Pseudomonadota bacterium]
MKLIISSKIMAELQGAARSGAPDENCGLLLGCNQHVTEARMTNNVASDPRRHFEIDPALLIAAEKDMRTGGLPIIGYYHSHPDGPVKPSATDARSAAPDGRIWLIINGQEAAAWQTSLSGRLLARFDPIDLECPLD